MGCLPLAAILVGGFILIGVFSGGNRDSTSSQAQGAADAKEEARRATLTPAERQAEDKRTAEKKMADEKAKAQRETAFQRAMVVAKAIKSNAHDPASVEFTEALVTTDGSVAITFRAKNALGAKVINRAVVSRDGKSATGSESSVASLWNRYIAGKDNIDVTSSIRGANSMGAI